MLIHRRRATGTGLLVAFCACQPSFADSSTTASQVPSDNGVVKSGDVIIWNVNKTITKQTETAVSSGVSQSSAVPAAAPTAGDTAAAASAVKDSADKLAKMATPGAGASADDLARAKAANAAADAASAALLQANSDAFAAGASKSSSTSGKRAAVAKIVSDASNSTLGKDASSADTQARLDEQAAGAATMKAGQPGATAADRAAAVTATAKAAQSRQAANDKLAAAHAYVAATTDALVTASTSSPAEAGGKPKATVDDGQVCFPARAVFQVTNVVAAAKTPPAQTSSSSSSPPKDSTATTLVSNTQLVSGYFPARAGLFHPFHSRSTPSEVTTTATTSNCGDGIAPAVADKTYDFTSDQLSKQDFSRAGFTWGALVIPYKFYLSDRSIKSNSSTVAYAGYEGWLPGLSLSTVFAAGPGLTTSSTTTAGSGTNTTTTKSSTFVTYTLAVGVIAAFGDSKNFKVGLLFGRDYQGKDANFQYENKNWLALSVGVGI